MSKVMLTEEGYTHLKAAITQAVQQIKATCDELLANLGPFQIFVNTKRFLVSESEIGYAEVIQLASLVRGIYMDPTDMYTVTYHKSQSKQSGTMTFGDLVKLEDATSFDVVMTNNA